MITDIYNYIGFRYSSIIFNCSYFDDDTAVSKAERLIWIISNKTLQWIFKCERFSLFLPKRYFVPARTFQTLCMNVCDLFMTINGQKRWTLRNNQEGSGMVNGKRRWTAWNVHTVQDKWSETFAKSLSHDCKIILCWLFLS